MRMNKESERAVERATGNMESEIDRAIKTANEICQEKGLSKEELFCLKIGLSQFYVMREVFTEINNYVEERSKHPLLTSEDKSFNPSRPIDEIGNRVIKKSVELGIFNESEVGAYFLEETGVNTVGIGGNFAEIDSFDGTSRMVKESSIQSIGVSVYNQENEFRAAVIVNLARGEVLLVNNKEVSYYGQWQGENFVEGEFKINGENKERIEDIRISTIPKRISEDKRFANKGIFQNKERADYFMVGGDAVFSMMRGDIEVVLDPVGQPPYEYLIWLPIFERMGCTVIGTEKCHEAVERTREDKTPLTSADRSPFIVISSKVLEELREELIEKYKETIKGRSLSREGRVTFSPE